jgi:hypothetical protein
MRRLLRWILPMAALAVLASAALEIEGLHRSGAARERLRTELWRAVGNNEGESETRAFWHSVLSRELAWGQDASTSHRLGRWAEAHPTAQAWRFAALAELWNSNMGRSAARRAERAARLAPGDAAAQALVDETLDVATLDEVREVSRGVGAVSLGLLTLSGLGALSRAWHARRRRAWLRLVTLRVLASADGQGPPAGGELAVGSGARDVRLDVFVEGGAGPTRGRGPTLSVAISHGRESRTLRLRPVKDLRQDAVRLHLSPESLAHLRRHPGRWKASVALDGRPMAETVLQVA